MKSPRLKERAFALLFEGPGYIFTKEDQQAFETALLEDYEDYMTDRISREPGKVFDRKETIKEFLKQL